MFCHIFFTVTKLQHLDQSAEILHCPLVRYGDRLTDFFIYKIAKLLGIYSIKATVFVLGNELQVAGDILNGLVHAGHETGFHPYSYLHAGKRSPVAVYRDIS